MRQVLFFLVVLGIAFSADVSEAEAPCDFPIGVIAALSGRLAEYGDAIRNGIELARKQHPERFRCLRFIYEDDQYDPKLAVSALEKLVTNDHVRFVYQWGNEPALALSPVATRLKVPLVTISQHPDIDTSDESFVVRFINSGADWQGAFLQHLRMSNVRSVLVVRTEMSFTEMLVNELAKAGGSELRVEVLESVLPTETDFRNVILRAKQKSFDRLALYLVPAQLSAFVKQAGELGFRPQYVGSTFFESRSIVGPSSGALPGATYLHLGMPSGFAAQYQALYAKRDQMPYAWDAYELALYSAKRFGQSATSPSASEILTAFRDPAYLDGPMRYYRTEGGGGYWAFPLAVYELTPSGEPKEILRIVPETT